MRLHEINNDSILKILYRCFDVDEAIVNSGRISIKGNVATKAAADFPNDELPVKFDRVDGHFLINSMNLSSLKGCPNFVGGQFNCGYNQLTSLVGGPKIVRDYTAGHNPLTSLDGLPEQAGTIVITYKEHLPLLKLLLINGLKSIAFLNSGAHTSAFEVQSILNKYLGQGRGGMLACAAELTKAGLKGNARL